MTKTTSLDAAFIPKITSFCALWGSRLGQQMTMEKSTEKPVLVRLRREFCNHSKNQRHRTFCVPPLYIARPIGQSMAQMAI